MMGTRLIQWALDEAPGDLPPVQLLTLVSLAEWARDSTGECWPSREAIATRIRRSERTADRVLAELVNRGLLELVRPAAPGRSAVYRLVRRAPYVAHEHATTVAHDRETPLSHVAADRASSVSHDAEATCASPDSNVRHSCLERAPSDGAQNRQSRQGTVISACAREETAAVIDALRDRTGKTIDEHHATLIIKQLLEGREEIRNRRRYLAGAINSDSNPSRFLPTPTPPRYGDELS